MVTVRIHPPAPHAGPAPPLATCWSRQAAPLRARCALDEPPHHPGTMDDIAAPSRISGTRPSTRNGAPVAARMASTVTPGARSRSTSPSSVGSITAMSVTTRVTRRVPVIGKAAAAHDLRLALRGGLHRDDHPPRARDEIHGAAHARAPSGRAPSSSPGAPARPPAARRGPSCRDARPGSGRRRSRCRSSRHRQGADEAAAGIGQVGSSMPSGGRAPKPTIPFSLWNATRMSGGT